MKLRFLRIIVGIVLCSCTNKGGSLFSGASGLPSYSGIDFDKIFSQKDNTFEHKDSILSVLNTYYQKIWEGRHLSGGLLIAKGDNIIFEKYKGYAKDNKREPIGRDTPMHIASTSKTMTAMAVMKLVEAGIINLNQALTDYFPNFPYKKVRIIDLLTQRSGLPKYEHFVEEIKPAPKQLNKKFLTNQDILDLMEAYKPPMVRPANTGFMYCNTNFALLALIIEKATKAPYPEAMQEILFKPLGMSHTFVFQEKDIPTAAQSFYASGKRCPLDRLDLIYGDKNIYTTPRDLLRFSQAMYSPKFLNEELRKKIFIPYSNEKKGIRNYGIGFRMKIYDGGRKLVYHNGWWHGTNSVFVHMLESKTTIIAIGNKFSKSIYTAEELSGLFGDYPEEREALLLALKEKND
ncbi:serine hydrolase domain-containing protein [Riemerella columbipharyngis]|uniref:CubicO group peptidase, beta-lactamase class C family n=1 Tax=Riemerella columbipharyngis TaxID=1071918 RepID=A0A1G7AE15_9FLAO|nr:serine hydrolase domain-containing protein [Riemerella columbipharyngis]SDE13061.1 CubicO group peptidase, beta-lactamase class C family [Riemerella columbipharyngis]